MEPHSLADYAALGALVLTAALVYLAYRSDGIFREIRDLLRRIAK
jgi:hypothetical protein